MLILDKLKDAFLFPIFLAKLVFLLMAVASYLSYSYETGLLSRISE